MIMVRNFFISVASLIYFLNEGVATQELDGTIRKLRKDLLKNYDKYSRPVFRHQNTTTVAITIDPKHIVELDEATGIFVFDCWILMNWHDEHLQWNPEDYDDLKLIHFADHEIWQPDITVYNAADSAIDPLQKQFAIVYSNGNVTWVPPAEIKVTCEINYENFPYDTQECWSKFGSWTANGYQINLVLRETAWEGFHATNPSWKLVTFVGNREVMSYACCEEPYVSVRFNFTIQRRGHIAHHFNRLLRTIAHVLILSMFWITSDSCHKILPGLFGILSYIGALFVTISTVRSPVAMEFAMAPLGKEIAAGLAALLIEVIIFNISNITDYNAPKVANILSKDVFQMLFCLCVKPQHSSKYSRVDAGSGSTENISIGLRADSEQHTVTNKDWHTIGTIFDRMLFIMFIVIFLSLGNYF